VRPGYLIIGFQVGVFGEGQVADSQQLESVYGIYVPLRETPLKNERFLPAFLPPPFVNPHDGRLSLSKTHKFFSRRFVPLTFLP